MRREASVWLDGQTWLVTARSPFESGLYLEDGWLCRVESPRPDPAVLGRSVRDALQHSTSQGRLPFALREPWKEQGLPALELGYPTLAALERAGVLLVNILLKGQQLWVSPMRNEGPGRGYAGDPAAQDLVVERSGLDSEAATLFVAPADSAVVDGSIGAMVLQAMATSRTLTQG